LFTIEDVTDEVNEYSEDLEDRITQMLEIIDSPFLPEGFIGPHCSNPYDCPLTECWEGLPEHNVFTLYYGGKKSYELYNNGIFDITSIPPDYKLNDKQLIQCDSVINSETYIDKAAISEFLAELEYPLYYLDFETFATAIPLFDGVRPYQNIPFQFSLHVQEAPGSKPDHFEFLAEGKDDPRPALLRELQKAIGDSGSIVVYNQSFEKRVLRELGETFTEYAEWCDTVIDRIADLIIPFRSFHYYNPDQKGSASLKKVLPAVTGSGYEDMNIARGDDASLAFLSITFDELPAEEVEQMRTDLLKYCGLDTEGMVRIVEQLVDMTG